MSEALLSRFDLVFILLDSSDEARDRHLSEHVLALHSGETPSMTLGETTHVPKGEEGFLFLWSAVREAWTSKKQRRNRLWGCSDGSVGMPVMRKKTAAFPEHLLLFGSGGLTSLLGLRELFVMEVLLRAMALCSGCCATCKLVPVCKSVTALPRIHHTLGLPRPGICFKEILTTRPEPNQQPWKRAGQDDRAGAARQALLEHRPVRLLTGPGGSQGPGGGTPGPSLQERLRLRPDDCHEPLPTQLLQKCGAQGNVCRVLATGAACGRPCVPGRPLYACSRMSRQ